MKVTWVNRKPLGQCLILQATGFTVIGKIRDLDLACCVDLGRSLEPWLLYLHRNRVMTHAYVTGHCKG